jgi:predicted component of type VI protein secretion system
MTPDLGNIDVSLLDTLARLEADQRSIRALAEKAAWHRDRVFEVYSRIVADYSARVSGIEEQVSEVRQRVREDLRRLEALYERARDGVDQARVELQESEFRREIGEFTREEFLQRQEAAKRTIAEREKEFEIVKALRLRYLELLPGEPAAPGPVGSAPPPAPPPAAAPAEPRAAEWTVRRVPTPATERAETEAAPAIPAAQPVPSDEAVTSLFTPPPSTGGPQEQTQAPSAEDAEAFATVAISSALLIEDRAGQPGAHHRLGVLTTIGRTPDNQVVVPVREVSRRHAEIVLTESGYVVKDLGSPNGTFVNGERITEHRLQDEDRIAMGGQVFVFTVR